MMGAPRQGLLRPGAILPRLAFAFLFPTSNGKA